MINIAELLKDAPKGMKLYSPLFGEVKLDDAGGMIYVTTKYGSSKCFTETGCYYVDSETFSTECLLFPSKDCRTWEGWKLPVEPKFNVEDWLVYKDGGTFCGGLSTVQVQTVEKDRYIFTHDTYSTHRFIDSECRLWSITDARDGDVLAADECYVIFKEIDGLNIKCYCTYHYMGFNPSFHIDTLQNKTAFKPAAKEQRDLLFSKMREAGYEWDADKKEIRKIKPHYDIKNFKPKQWVLVRDDDEWEWALTRFSHLSNGSASLFICINGASFQQCIPFEGNETLLGTTNPCDEQYINW